VTAVGAPDNLRKAATSTQLRLYPEERSLGSFLSGESADMVLGSLDTSGVHRSLGSHPVRD